MPSSEDLEEVLRQVEDIGSLVEREYSGIEVSERILGRRTPGFHIGLAPLYGKLRPDKKSFKMMDMTLCLAIQVTLRHLSGREVKTMLWEDAVRLLRLNEALKDLHHDVFRQRTFVKRPTVHLRAHYMMDRKDEFEVETWFRELVQDEDVLSDTRIDTKVLAGIMASSDVAVNSLRSMIHKTERRTTPLLDIGFIRFPSLEQPFFRVYRIQLNVWVKRKLSLGIIQKDSSGIDGRYSSYDFGPSQAILDKVDPQVRAQARRDLERELCAHM